MTVQYCFEVNEWHQDRSIDTGNDKYSYRARIK